LNFIDGSFIIVLFFVILFGILAWASSSNGKEEENPYLKDTNEIKDIKNIKGSLSSLLNSFKGINDLNKEEQKLLEKAVKKVTSVIKSSRSQEGGEI